LLALALVLALALAQVLASALLKELVVEPQHRKQTPAGVKSTIIGRLVALTFS